MYRILENCCIERGLTLDEVLPLIGLEGDDLRDVAIIEDRLDSIEQVLLDAEGVDDVRIY